MEQKVDEIHFAGRVIKLNAPASQELEVRGSTPLLLAWEPEDRQATEIEVRARIVTIFQPDSEDLPRVKWHAEIGHGNDQWRDPQGLKDLSARSMFTNYTLPARGMVWRAATRYFRIAFANDGYVGDVLATLHSVIQVSVLPVRGADIDVYPYAIRCDTTASEAHPFPITAREFRLLDIKSNPTPPTIITITFQGISGDDFAVADAWTYRDWTPIPHEAAGFKNNAPVYAYYR